MDMEDTVEGIMEATEDTTTARGPLMLRLRLMLSQPPLLSQAMVITEDTSDITLTDTDTLLLTPMDIMVIMARGLLMPSLPMVTLVTVTGTALTDTEAMVMEPTEDTTTARGLLMLSPDTGTTAMDTEVIVGDTMGMVMVMDTDTTVEKFQKFMLIQSD